MFLGLPWWIWLLIGFAIEWLLELIWWRGRHWNSSNELTQLRGELSDLRSKSSGVNGDIKGLRGDLDGAVKAKSDLEANLKASTLELTGVRGKLTTLQSEFDKLKGDHGVKLGELETRGTLQTGEIGLLGSIIRCQMA